MFKKYFILYFVIFSLFLILCNESSGQEEGFIFHSVEKKETLFSISRKYNVSIEELYKYNPSTKQNLKTGDVLQIPKKIKNDTPKRVTSFTYKVRKGESLYFIAKKFNCTQDEILKLNPGLSSSLKKGMIIRIPSPQKTNESGSSFASDENFTTYKIAPGDTYFNLNKRFGIERAELEKINPALKNGIKAGMVIRIPKRKIQDQSTSVEKNITPADEKDNKQMITEEKATGYNPDKVYTVGFFLPIRSSQNDSANISPSTRSYLEFYEGAMIAAAKMKAEGMKLKMYLYDTDRDPKVVEKLVKKPEFLSFDLIIGPVYTECQKVVSDLSAKNRIPLISPLVPAGRHSFTNPYYYLVNPDRKIRLNATADYIASEFKGQHVVLLSPGNNGVASKLKQSGSIHLKTYDLWADDRSGIENQLNPEGENIVVLAEEDEARVSVAITRLNTMAKKFKVTLIGLQEYTRLKSINVEYLHNVNLRYLSSYWVDYNSRHVIDFIEKYRSAFSSEPNQYSFQGFDVTAGFLSALKSKGKNINNTAFTGTHLLQSDYNFHKVSDLGGYINNQFYIVEYTDDYDVISSGKIKGGI